MSRKGLSDQLEGRPRLSVSMGGRGVRPGSDLCLLPVVPCQTSTSSGLSTSVPPPPWPVGSTIETSGGPDLSDSPSSGGVVAQPPLRKVKVSGVLGCLMPGPGCVYGGYRGPGSGQGMSLPAGGCSGWVGWEATGFHRMWGLSPNLRAESA